MKKIPGMADIKKLSGNEQKKQIDEINEFIYTNIFNDLEDPKEAAQTLLDISKKLDYKRGIAFSELNLGNYYCSLSSPEGLNHLNHSLILFEELGDSLGILRSLNNLGSTYKDAGLYDKALDYRQKTLTLAQKTGNKEYQAGAYANLAGNLINFGKYPEAKSYLEKALELAGEVDMENKLAIIYQSYAQVLSHLNEKERALEYYQKALDKSRELGQILIYINLLNDIGEGYVYEGKLDEAMP